MCFYVWLSFSGFLYYSAKKYIEKRRFYTVVVNFSAEMGNMETASLKLAKLIQKFNHPHICLVGISAAGLVSYEYLNSLDGWNKIDTFIALATPFKGTHMAYFQYHRKTGGKWFPQVNIFLKYQK